MGCERIATPAVDPNPRGVDFGTPSAVPGRLPTTVDFMLRSDLPTLLCSRFSTSPCGVDGTEQLSSKRRKKTYNPLNLWKMIN
jgi:hypothetical protein